MKSVIYSTDSVRLMIRICEDSCILGALVAMIIASSSREFLGTNLLFLRNSFSTCFSSSKNLEHNMQVPSGKTFLSIDMNVPLLIRPDNWYLREFENFADRSFYFLQLFPSFYCVLSSLLRFLGFPSSWVPVRPAIFCWLSSWRLI